jgi:hypothetical protein
LRSADFGRKARKHLRLTLGVFYVLVLVRFFEVICEYRKKLNRFWLLMRITFESETAGVNCGS